MSAPRRHWERKTHPREDPSLFPGEINKRRKERRKERKERKTEEMVQKRTFSIGSSQQGKVILKKVEGR
jgi:hypothetical protein